MKKHWHIIFLGILTLLFLLPNSTWAACPAGKTAPDACKSTADQCGSEGWCGCDKSTTSEFKCMDKTKGEGCVEKLCPGTGSNQCCKLKAASATPSTSTAAAGGGGGTFGPILPECVVNGRCSLCDMIQTMVNFGEFLFAVSGALLLLFIFYGGFLMLISGGNPQTVGKGKSAMVNAVIGILIVFTAYMGVNFIIAAVTGNWDWAGNLKCAPLPKEEPWVAGIAGQGAGGEQLAFDLAPGQTAASSTACASYTKETECTADTKNNCEWKNNGCIVKIAPVVTGKDYDAWSCGRITTKYECYGMASRGCYWSSKYCSIKAGLAKPPDTTKCPTYTSSAECTADTSCQWYANYSCTTLPFLNTSMSAKSCGLRNTEAECMTFKCYWDTSTNPDMCSLVQENMPCYFDYHCGDMKFCDHGGWIVGPLSCGPVPQGICKPQLANGSKCNYCFQYVPLQSIMLGCNDCCVTGFCKTLNNECQFPPT